MNDIFQKILLKSESFIKKESPIILTCIGAAGVVATAVMTYRATPKALRLLEEAEEEKEAELTALEKIRVAGPVYIPTALIGVSTVVCILGANVLNQKHQASLMSAYGVLDSSYKNYRCKLKELYGEDRDVEIQDSLSRDRFRENPMQASDEKLLWYEPYRDEFFEMTEKELIDAEYHLNRNFVLRGETNLNEFYEFLGLEPTDAGCDIGWSMYADDFSYEAPWIDFEHHLVLSEDGETEYYRIEMVLSSRDEAVACDY